MIRSMSRRVTPMVPLFGSGVGLLEKRVDAFSGLEFVSTATEVGEWNHGLSSSLLLDSDAVPHNNHGSDPGSVTMALVGSVGLVMDRPRFIHDTFSLSSIVHVTLDGYHPGGGGTQLIETLVAGVPITVGQPVCVLTTNTANLANNYLGVSPDEMIGHPIGLANTTSSGGADVDIVTEGTVTQSDWALVTGSTFLVPGAWYYLNGPTAGKLTLIPPTTAGRMNIRVGRAIDAQRFDIEISEGVIL